MLAAAGQGWEAALLGETSRASGRPGAGRGPGGRPGLGQPGPRWHLPEPLPSHCEPEACPGLQPAFPLCPPPAGQTGAGALAAPRRPDAAQGCRGSLHPPQPPLELSLAPQGSARPTSKSLCPSAARQEPGAERGGQVTLPPRSCASGCQALDGLRHLPSSPSASPEGLRSEHLPSAL